TTSLSPTPLAGTHTHRQPLRRIEARVSFFLISSLARRPRDSAFDEEGIRREESRARAMRRVRTTPEKRDATLRSLERFACSGPRGTVCAQGCAQTSRTDAISGVSREGRCTRTA